MLGKRGRRTEDWVLWFHQLLFALQIAEPSHTGSRAMGADMGIPTILHHIHLVWKPCLSSPANASNAALTFSSPITEPGNTTSTSFPPLSSSSLRRLLNGGILFNPHSSCGILSNNLFPYDVTFFCQPFSAFSHFNQVLEARVVSLST